MNLISRLSKWLLKEIAEIIISILLFVSLLWSLYDGNLISWTIFTFTLLGVVFFILKPKKNVEPNKHSLDKTEVNK